MKRTFRERILFLLMGLVVGCILSPVIIGLAGSFTAPHENAIKAGRFHSADQIRTRPGSLRDSATGPILTGLITDVALGPARLSQTEERLRRWTSSDPDAALTWAAALPIPSERSRMMEIVFRTWGCLSIDKALAKANAELTGEVRQLAVRAALDGLAESDPQAALASLSGLEDQKTKQGIQNELLLRIIHLDPAAAMDYAGKTDSAVRSMALSAWQESDPRAALAWVCALPDGLEKQGGLLQMADVWVATEPEHACEYATRLSDLDARAAFCSTVAAALLQKDRTKAMAWVASITDETARAAASDSLCNALAAKDPPVAADYAANLANQTQRSESLVSAVGAWASTDAASAGAWVAAFPEGQLKEQAISSLADSAVSQSPDAFGAWLDGAIPASLRDAVISQVIDKSRAAGSAWAADWALKVGDSSARWQNLTGVVRRWKDLDPAAAKEWIVRTQLPDGWQDHLNELMDKE
jgi:hypothetical protein